MNHSALRAGLLVGLVGVGLGGCTNARDEFVDFGDRIVDASNQQIDGTIVSELPDLTGRWFLVVRPDLPKDRFFRYIVDYTFEPVTENTGLLAFTGICLDVNTDEEVAPAMMQEGIEVASDATFDAPLMGEVPGACNSVTGTTVQANATLHGTILSDSFICGDASGEAGGLSLAGTQWAGQRFEGTELPEAIWRCEDQPAE